MTTLATPRPLFALAATLALAACTLPTKLGELTDGAETTDPQATTGADDPTTDGGQDTIPINSGGVESSEDTGDGTTADATSGDAPCSEVTVTRTPVAPNVILVLDKSGSMVTELGGFWDHDDDPLTPDVTRWSSLHEVVETVVTDFDAAINFGAHLFPGAGATAQYDENACVLAETVEIPVAAMNRDEILAGIPLAGDESLRGGTPTTAAMTTALAHLKTLDPSVPRAVLLVTDGAANCAEGTVAPPLFELYDDGVHDVVADAFTIDGIPTYVVGVGIEDVESATAQDGKPDATNTFDRLNQLATEGGKPRNDPNEKFFNTTNQIELAAALGDIAVDALTCIVTLDPAPLTPEGTVVVLDDETIPQVTDCATEDGWVYQNPDGPFDAIELCGAACGGLKIIGAAEVTVCSPR